MDQSNQAPSVMERYLTEIEEKALLRSVDRVNDIYARRDAAWIRALLYSGMRITEFSLVTVGDVLDAMKLGSLFVPKEHRKGFNPDPKKNRADDHRVRLHDPLRRALNQLLRVRAEMGASGDRDGALVISRSGGEGMTVRGFQMRFKLWASEAGLPEHASPHWLRHTGCMRVVRTTTAANPLLAAQRFAGHRSLSSTGVYIQVNKEEMDEALSQAFGGSARNPGMAKRRAMWQQRAGV